MSNPVQVRWYGERGIVNALVTHIASAADPLMIVRDLLDAVVWADGKQPPWVQRVTDAEFVVEISLSEFGNPDLLLVCHTEGEDKPYVVFFEAKIRSYRLSMGKNPQTMTAGYNSTIKGQISLKYRFAQALSASNPTDSRIAEPETLFKQYKDKIIDSATRARRLEKPAVLSLLNRLRLLPLSEDRCHYVALTRDKEIEHVFPTPTELRPVLLDEAGNDVYNAVCPRLGWLGYQRLDTVLASETAYREACQTMFFRRPEEYLNDAHGTDDLSGYQPHMIEVIADMFRAACSETAQVKMYTASTSIIVGGKTLVKLIPTGTDALFIGVREHDKADVDPARFTEQRTIQAVPFRGFNLSMDVPDVAADEDLRALVAAVGDGYGPL
jgi:hypothetical protein